MIPSSKKVCKRTVNKHDESVMFLLSAAEAEQVTEVNVSGSQMALVSSLSSIGEASPPKGTESISSTLRVTSYGDGGNASINGCNRVGRRRFSELTWGH